MYLIQSLPLVGGGSSFIRDIERTIKIIFVCSIPNITKIDIKEHQIELNIYRSSIDII